MNHQFMKDFLVPMFLYFASPFLPLGTLFLKNNLLVQVPEEMAQRLRALALSHVLGSFICNCQNLEITYISSTK